MSERPQALVLKFGRLDSTFLVRVEGRGTMHVSPAFQEFARQALECEPQASLVIDLSRCEYLDSTFLGCLVSLHREFGHARPPRLVVTAPADARARLLARARLDQVLNVLGEPPPEPQEWLTIPPRSLEQRDFARHLIDCHRRLAELGGPDAAAFQRVADQLSRELGEA